ncbi:TMED4 protein, partial [Leiothrix lutea]|nr:TMED4 protein [Leiothrix lutea]
GRAGGTMAALGEALRAAVAALLLLSWSAHGLYFHIGETEKRCFIEEIPDETMVIGTGGGGTGREHREWREGEWERPPGIGERWCCPGSDSVPVAVTLSPRCPQVVLSRQYGSEGRFTFTSHTPGEHQICLHSNSTRMALFAGGKLRVHLDIQVGEHTNNYPEM